MVNSRWAIGVQQRARKCVELTRKDMLAALDVPAHLFRQWLEKLSPYKDIPTKARVARKFGPRDLLFFYVIQCFIQEMGLNVEAVARFSQSLADCLARPLGAPSQGYLFVNLATGSVQVLKSQPPLESGLIVMLEPHLQKLREYLNYDLNEAVQQDLPLGLMDVNA